MDTLNGVSLEDLARGRARVAGMACGSLMDRVEAAVVAGFEDGVISATFGVSENLVRQVRARRDMPGKDDRTIDTWAVEVAPQFVEDVDAHISVFGDGRTSEEAYVLRRLIMISLRQLFRDKGLT